MAAHFLVRTLCTRHAIYWPYNEKIVQIGFVNQMWLVSFSQEGINSVNTGREKESTRTGAVPTVPDMYQLLSPLVQIIYQVMPSSTGFLDLRCRGGGASCLCRGMKTVLETGRTTNHFDVVSILRIMCAVSSTVAFCLEAFWALKCSAFSFLRTSLVLSWSR